MRNSSRILFISLFLASMLGVFLFLQDSSAQEPSSKSCSKVASPATYHSMEATDLADALISAKLKESYDSSDLPPAISKEELIAGLQQLKNLMFKDVQQFLRWKSQDWTASTNIGTQGFKILLIVVALKTDKKKIQPVEIFLFDVNGTYGSHSELALLASEAFGETQLYESRYNMVYNGQLVVSKFNGEPLKYLESGDINVRIAAQEHLDKTKPIPEAWGQIETLPIP